MRQKDGSIYSDAQIRQRHPQVSFSEGTYEELGYLPYTPPIVPPTAEQLREQAKMARAVAVSKIRVTVTSGKVFDGDEESQGRMARVILIAQIAGLTSTTWTLADNSVVTVTLAELQEALVLAGLQQAALWPI